MSRFEITNFQKYKSNQLKNSTFPNKQFFFAILTLTLLNRPEQKKFRFFKKKQKNPLTKKFKKP